MDLQNIKYVVGNKEFNKNRLITIDDNVLLNADFLNQQVQKVFGSANISEAFQNMQSLSNHPQTRFNIALYSSDFATSYDKVLSSITTINDFANHYGIRKENVRFYIIYDYEPDYDYKQVIALSNINSAVNSNFGNQLLFPSNFNTAQKIYTHSPNKTQTSLKIVDFDESWNFTDVLQANQTLNIVSTAINTAGLSPYEKYLAVYSFINNFAYKAENDNEPISTSRRIVPVLVGDSIVCAGFTQLFMALCDRVGLPNLSTSVARQSRGDYHIMNVIKIQDEKYGIDGIYEVDATFDTRSKNTSSIINKKYINHLLPVGNYTRTHRYIPDNPTFPNPVGKAIIQPHILKSDPVKFDIKVETSFNLTELQVYKFLENKGLIEGKIITQSDALQDSNTALEQLKEQGLSQQEIDKAMTAIIDNKLKSAKKSTINQ